MSISSISSLGFDQRSRKILRSGSAGTGHDSYASSVNPSSNSTSASVGLGSTLADLTASVRRTNGLRPPPLVGCSITLVNDHVYVFGGRLVPTRVMVSTLYSLSLRTLAWKLRWSSPSTNAKLSRSDLANQTSLKNPGPCARYFHSAELWSNKIIIFGGEGYGKDEDGKGVEEGNAPLITLGDTWVWDIDAKIWSSPAIGCLSGVEPPAPRYAHLAVVLSASSLDFETDDLKPKKEVMLIMGGQDINNTYLQSANVLDLTNMSWIFTSKWDKHIGTYRAVATSSKSSTFAGDIFISPLRKQSSAEEKWTDKVDMVQLSYSKEPSLEDLEPIMLFSNYNFTQVRRDLDLLVSPLSSLAALQPKPLSSKMTGSNLPPGLRFPTGAVLGSHLIIFGTVLSQSSNAFSIWALELSSSGARGVPARSETDLETLTWSRIDPGAVLAKGSWNKAVVWKNTAVIFGDRGRAVPLSPNDLALVDISQKLTERDIVSDYDHRQINFSHVAYVDLEAFGVYEPPPQAMSVQDQAIGLYTLSQRGLSDFEIICSDNIRLGCSRRVLAKRWPWFEAHMKETQQKLQEALAEKWSYPKTHVASNNRNSFSEYRFGTTNTSVAPESESKGAAALKRNLQAKLRLLHLPEPSPVVEAFLQYIYTLTLCTPLQLSVPVLNALLVFSDKYGMDALKALVVHALHVALKNRNTIAASIYEAATLTHCTALQIRALKVMMAATRRLTSEKLHASSAGTASDAGLRDG